jgi:hypothetical protein
LTPVSKGGEVRPYNILATILLPAPTTLLAPSVNWFRRRSREPSRIKNDKSASRPERIHQPHHPSAVCASGTIWSALPGECQQRAFHVKVARHFQGKCRIQNPRYHRSGRPTCLRPEGYLPLAILCTTTSGVFGPSTWRTAASRTSSRPSRMPAMVGFTSRSGIIPIRCVGLLSG